MKRTTIFLAATILAGLFSEKSEAQKNNKIESSIFYPMSLGNNFLNNNFNSVVGWNLGYEHHIAGHFWLGASYSGSLSSKHLIINDEAGIVSGEDLVTIIVHDLDPEISYLFLPSKKLNPCLSLRAGYTIVNGNLDATESGRENEQGININPGAKLYVNLTRRFSIFSSVSYSYRFLFNKELSVNTSFDNNNLESLNAGAGALLYF